VELCPGGKLSALTVTGVETYNFCSEQRQLPQSRFLDLQSFVSLWIGVGCRGEMNLLVQRFRHSLTFLFHLLVSATQLNSTAKRNLMEIRILSLRLCVELDRLMENGAHQGTKEVVNFSCLRDQS
jgi:hypothetical protein